MIIHKHSQNEDKKKENQGKPTKGTLYGMREAYCNSLPYLLLWLRIDMIRVASTTLLPLSRIYICIYMYMYIYIYFEVYTRIYIYAWKQVTSHTYSVFLMFFNCRFPPCNVNVSLRQCIVHVPVRLESNILWNCGSISAVSLLTLWTHKYPTFPSWWRVLFAPSYLGKPSSTLDLLLVDVPPRGYWQQCSGFLSSPP